MADLAAPECSWYLLVHTDGEAVTLDKFGDVGGLRNAIMAAWPAVKMLNEDVEFFIFFGVQAHITQGEQPCLLHPDGTLIQLYDQEDTIKLIEGGAVNQRDSVEVTESTAHTKTLICRRQTTSR
jgi:hypothetical protein